MFFVPRDHISKPWNLEREKGLAGCFLERFLTRRKCRGNAAESRYFAAIRLIRGQQKTPKVGLGYQGTKRQNLREAPSLPWRRMADNY
jgi:hypothetical protein